MRNKKITKSANNHKAGRLDASNISEFFKKEIKDTRDSVRDLVKSTKQSVHSIYS